MCFESKFRRLDGTILDLEISLHVIDTKEKRFVQGIIRDITARKQAEETLRESEERHQILSSI